MTVRAAGDEVLVAPRTAAGLLAERAEADPGAALVEADGTCWTVGAVHERAREWAARLVGAGVRPGDVVATALHGADAAVALFAVELAGAVELPVSPRLPADRTAQALHAARCRLLLTDSPTLGGSPGLQAVEGQALVVVVHPAPDGERGVRTLADRPARALPGSPPDPLGPGLVISTSGTTGPAKAVLLPRAAGVRHARRVALSMDYGPQDVLLNVFPWHHVNVRHAALLPALLTGARLVVEDRFSASAFWGVCRRSGVTAFNFMGAMAAILLRAGTPAGPHRVRRAYGGPAPASLVTQFAERFGVLLLEAYACTELGDIATNTVTDVEPGSAGRPVPEYDVRVVGATGDAVATGTVGRIVVRERIAGTRLLGHLCDGAVRPVDGTATETGDLGRLDDQGRLWFAGRTTDSVRRRGENISCWQVEQVLAEAPGVSEVAVVGVPSELTEEDVLAVVVATPGSAPDPQSVWQHAARSLPAHEVPRWLRFVEHLPRNASQKVDKAALRAAGTAGAAERDR